MEALGPGIPKVKARLWTLTPQNSRKVWVHTLGSFWCFASPHPRISTLTFHKRETEAQSKRAQQSHPGRGAKLECGLRTSPLSLAFGSPLVFPETQASSQDGGPRTPPSLSLSVTACHPSSFSCLRLTPQLQDFSRPTLWGLGSPCAPRGFGEAQSSQMGAGGATSPRTGRLQSAAQPLAMSSARRVPAAHSRRAPRRCPALPSPGAAGAVLAKG